MAEDQEFIRVISPNNKAGEEEERESSWERGCEGESV